MSERLGGHWATAVPSERLSQHSEAHLNWSLITLMTRRLTRKPTRWTKKTPAADGVT
ncbi:hypothetical protein [Streptomyces sp. IBSBF 2390]|uniref:hypothetical protein n=1 Tax=Streptomyces sp. IBSBF 2390 TaxID=2903533 RepID=UPI003FA772B9